ncbi:MAG TPA: hypothetical protein VEA44_12990 [Caulobacter sp.]|nr:hypothetical protein [Caulobacter sp.]
MAIFPKIQSPCPLKANLARYMDGDTCRMCKRQVHDLSAMSDGQRLAFMQGCAEEVCVSYRLPAKLAAAAAMASLALATPLAAAAQDVEPDEVEMQDLIVGGIKDLKKVEYIEDQADAAIPELPIVYENEPEVSDADEAPKPVKESAGT